MRDQADQLRTLVDTAGPCAREVQDGLLGSARYEVETDYLMFTPPGLGFLRFVDRALAWLPLGAQYVVAARKAA